MAELWDSSPKKLTNTEQKHSAVEKEAYAIVSALKKFFCWVDISRLSQDQRSMSFMFVEHHQNKVKKEKLQRWCLGMSCYHYEIIYKPSNENTVYDFF